MRRARLAGLCAAGAISLALLPASPGLALPSTWTSVGSDSSSGVSGIAPGGSGWVIVHDNKAASQNRVARLDEDAAVTPLAWPGTPPRDLEAIDRVPGASERYVVLTSSGSGWVVSLGATAVTIERTFHVPGSLKQIEAFALTSVGATTVAVWASRGSTTAPAKVMAATFDPDAASFGKVSAKQKVRVPYPTTHVRQVSDLKVVDGRILISATSDPGSRGPFTSAVYDVGSVDGLASNGKPVLTIVAPVERERFAGHKVEGIACTDGVGVLGADDEKLGGAVTEASICPVGASHEGRLSPG